MAVSFNPKFVKFGTSGNTLLIGLVSYWKLNEVSGAAIDETSFHNLTVTGATQNISGKLGTAYSFDGNDYLGSIDTDYEFTGSFSISVWFKRATGLTAYECMVSNYHYTDGSGYDLVMTTSGYIAMTVRNPLQTPTSSSVMSIESTWDDNAWHHCVVTWDGTYCRLYLDGNLNNTSAAWTHPISYYVDSRFRIGIRANTLYWGGSLDEIGIWNKTLNLNEVTTLWNSGTGKTHPFS